MTIETVVQNVQAGPLQPYISDPALQRQLETPQPKIAEPLFPEFTIVKGIKGKYNLRVRTQAIDLMKLKMVRNKFKLPDPPLYEIKLPSGRTESVMMDEEAAKDNPTDMKRWKTYMSQVKSAESEQNDRIVTTIFFLGAELVDPMPTDWEMEQELLGIDIPAHPQMKVSHFLITETTKEEIQELLRCIMGKSGVTESEIAVAEEAFRG